MNTVKNRKGNIIEFNFVNRTLPLSCRNRQQIRVITWDIIELNEYTQKQLRYSGRKFVLFWFCFCFK